MNADEMVGDLRGGYASSYPDYIISERGLPFTYFFLFSELILLWILLIRYISDSSSCSFSFFILSIIILISLRWYHPLVNRSLLLFLSLVLSIYAYSLMTWSLLISGFPLHFTLNPSRCYVYESFVNNHLLFCDTKFRSWSYPFRALYVYFVSLWNLWSLVIQSHQFLHRFIIASIRANCFHISHVVVSLHNRLIQEKMLEEIPGR